MSPSNELPSPADDHPDAAVDRTVPRREHDAAAAERRSRPFPIAGLGASAGGLEALEQFFAAMPGDSGIACVVITHLHPGQRSLLAELLGRKTTMPVHEVDGPTRVRPDHVYTARPGFVLSIEDGTLLPLGPIEDGARRMPIDAFFRSLARDAKERAIAVVLSGTGSDGSLGVKEIKAELGMVMAQDEQSARYPDMPRNAVATHAVDYVLPVSAMPAQLVAYGKSLLGEGDGAPGPEIPEERAEVVQQIFARVRQSTGHDFAQYKRSTILRRIERRMHVHHLGATAQYLEYLRENPAECSLLFKELLIGVTSFFRDAEAWHGLAAALGRQLSSRPADQPFRAWVAGCSTGEEAYSLAILLREIMEGRGRAPQVQIFATDLDAHAIDVARNGVYPAGIANDVAAERLARFFTQDHDVYRVKKEIRDVVVFAPHDLIGNPPFTKLDLLLCRNVLIYFTSELQRQVLPIFHYALKPDGILFLGSSESVGNQDLFEPVDKKWKIFTRRGLGRGLRLGEFPAIRSGAFAGAGEPHAGGRPVNRFDHLAEQALLKEFVPPTVLVRENGDVVHVHGRTGQFLEPQPGSQTSANIFDMARDGLQLALAATIRQASSAGGEVVHRGVPLRSNGERVLVDLHVARLADPEPLRGLLRVTFRQVPAGVGEGAREGAEAHGTADLLGELERELLYTRESHQGTIEELETANEELKSTNEELQSANEELQSANEELETSKEEMQSLNEELQTVNGELHGKVEELSRANNDMKNLLNGTSIATVFLDEDLHIKRYTEQAKKVLPLIASDVGRPISDLVSSLQYDRLAEDARDVLATLVFKETEVRGNDGATWLMRILPYRTTENVIEGLVLTFVDVSRLKALQAEQERMLDALASSPACVFGQDRELRFTWACRKVFGRDVATLLGTTDAAVFPAGDVERLREIKLRVLASGVPERQRLVLEVDGRRRDYQLCIAPVRRPDGSIDGLSCVALDVGQGGQKAASASGSDA